MITIFTIPLIIFAIIEEIALTFNSLVFLKRDIDWRKILFIGSITGIATYLFRLLPLSFGFHSILTFIILSLLLSKIFKEQLIECFIAALKSFILLIITETISINLIVYFSEISLEEFVNSPILNILLGLPHILLLYLIGSILNSSRKVKEEGGKQIEL